MQRAQQVLGQVASHAAGAATAAHLLPSVQMLASVSDSVAHLHLDPQMRLSAR